MTNSKLLELLGTFSGRDWRTFCDLVAAPYFNRNADVLRLCTWLAEQKTPPTRAAAHVALFPTEPPNDARLNHLMSALLQLAETYLALESYQSDEPTRTRHTLQALSERGLDKHYQYTLQQWQRHSGAEPTAADDFWAVYRIEMLEAERQARSAPRVFNDPVQRATDALDTFYLLEKLRRTCYQLSSQAILATPYNLQLVDEVRRFVGAHLGELRSPAIEAYYRVVQLLTNVEPDADFQALKHLLAVQGPGLSPEDHTDVLQYAINFCNIQIQQVREAYVQEAFQLYVNGLESGVLLSNGQLSPWHFKNVCKLALRLQQYTWAERFIAEYTPQLAPEFQSDALHYNLAELYYYTGRPAESMQHLNQVEFSDVHYSLGAKVLLCKIYYEQDEPDALDSLLHAFNTYLRRNRVVGDNTRKVYLNFTRLLGRVVRALPAQYPAIEEEVQQTPLVAEKTWLLGRLR